jgi:hypothetical protein
MKGQHRWLKERQHGTAKRQWDGQQNQGKLSTCHKVIVAEEGYDKGEEEPFG